MKLEPYKGNTIRDGRTRRGVHDGRRNGVQPTMSEEISTRKVVLFPYKTTGSKRKYFGPVKRESLRGSTKRKFIHVWCKTKTLILQVS